MQTASSRSRIQAVLGPTNTGKTHLAVERMLAHETGMIGCPLRLLARELYDKIVGIRGRGAVALITGEEKIVPARPRYFVCTVEAMPVDRQVEFVAIDEIQLAADPERGHIFTDRLLRMRGLSETMFLGAATITPLIRKLVPETEFISRPRFSQLTYAGVTKVTRLPPRSAIVAFSAPEVYGLGEHLRRLRGGAAVVLGALSPRTRNAQVAMYQAGEVDYLVATDAIGMGINMNVDHVAFAATRKFDGRDIRPLAAPEVGQIAGRAGRHMRDGTFGTTAGAGPIDDEIVSAVEHHEFPPLTRLFWRNPDLDFRSVNHLIHTLDLPSPRKELVRPRDADDILSLKSLSLIPDIAKRARGYDQVSLLWDVCRIPDFRKMISDAHVSLLAAIYRHLSGPSERIPDSWVQKLLSRLDRPEGDIDTIAGRIAHVRTWNYVAHRADWVADARGLQERARQIEDRLSDALHTGLTQRFVDRRAAALARGQKDGEPAAVTVRGHSVVMIEEQEIGVIEGLAFVPEDQRDWRRDRNLRNAVKRATTPEWARRARRIEGEGDDAFTFNQDGSLCWRGSLIGHIQAGDQVLSPGIVLRVSDMMDAAETKIVRYRLEQYLRDYIARLLKPLWQLRDGAWSGAARGIVYQLVERLGVMPYREIADLLAELRKEDRRALQNAGIKIGQYSLFMPSLIKQRRTALRAQLWKLHVGRELPVVRPGAVSCQIATGIPADDYWLLGYAPFGKRAVRVDMLERLIGRLNTAAAGGAFPIDPAWHGLIGCPANDFASVVRALGFKPVSQQPASEKTITSSQTNADTAPLLYARTPVTRKKQRGQKGSTNTRDHSPFAALKSLRGSL